MQEKEAYIILNMVKEIGPIRFKMLKNYFHSAVKILEASEEELTKVPGITKAIAKNIKEVKDYDSELKRIKEENINILTLEDSEYPINLKAIFDPPPVIYLKGNLEKKDLLAIAIVGTRNATEYGKYWAKKLASELVKYDITVVSGLARGIDTCAHLGALEANGRTITVLGCGMNVFYPPENKKLREDISNHGCVISEFPLDSLPNKFNFPRRNRIISGLSLGVVVIEADINSGALITANLALEQGREVFALPGQVGSKTTRGVHYLIKQGAKLVESAEDILEEIDNIINFYRREGWTKREPKEEKEEVEEYKAKHEEESSFSNKERLILSMLTNQPEHIDNISYKTKINSTELSTILLQLELKGKIEQLFGKRFRRLN